MHGRRALILVVTSAVLASVPLLAQRKPQRSPQEQRDVEALVALVDESMMAETGTSAPPSGAPASGAPVIPKPLAFGMPDRNEGDVSVKWLSNHWVKGASGDTYVPFTLQLDKAHLTKGAALYIRVVNADQAEAFGSYEVAARTSAQGGKMPQRPKFEWDSVHFIDVPDSGQLSRAVQLKAGRYVAFIAVKEKSPASGPASSVTGLLRHEVVVPDYNSSELQISSVIMAQTVEQLNAFLPADQQESNPYVFGPMRIVPSIDARFPKSGDLSVIFWIYGAKEAATGKPDVVIDFSFHQLLPEGEKYFNKTLPQALNAETLPKQFSIAKGHQLPGSLVVPLSSFPLGDYRLEIKVTDKPSGKELTQSVNFSVV